MLLRGWRDGDRGALDELLPLVYAELRAIADAYMRRERADHTWRPTDLIGEAYLRLAGADGPELEHRAHFFGIAARTMRQILVDHARHHRRAKRGGGEAVVPLDEALVGVERPDALLALDDALTALAKLDERKARCVELHYFAGLTQQEIGNVLDVHVNTVARDLKLGELWLHRELRGAAS